METLNFPLFQFRFQEEQGRKQIFDRCRKKFVALTPEEWVRQHVVAYLDEIKKIPLPLISVEKRLMINRLEKRFDICVFDRKGEPVLLVECKAPGIELSQKTFDQAARYNMTMKVRFLVITNGKNTISCRIDYENRSFIQLEDIPDFHQLLD